MVHRDPRHFYCWRSYMSDAIKALKEFATIWNSSRLYPTNYDLERRLGRKMRAIRKYIDVYNKEKETHSFLPDLIWRREGTGQAIPVPAEALKLLDVFKIDLEMVKKAKGVIVTSSQFGANIHKGFWGSLNTCSKYRDFPLIVMPVKYGPIGFSGGRYTSTFPDELKGHLIFEDLILGDGQLQLNVTRMRPTLERFLTDTICEMGGSTSQIFAAPILELEHRPRIGHDHPKACMTTGSVSIPNYALDKLGQQDRTAEIAVSNHNYAAVIIEFEKGKFHFRQLSADSKGNFYDIDPINGGARLFTAKGHTHKPNAIEGLVLGDWHTGKTCPTVRDNTFGPKSMTDILRPKHVVLHDFVDGDSISKYEQSQATRRAWKAKKGYDSLEDELTSDVAELNWMRERAPYSKLNMVASNHPEFVTEYIDNMRWTKDDINLHFGSKIFHDVVSDLEKRDPLKVDAIGTDPVILYLRNQCPFVNVMERTDTLFLGNGEILCSMHGDIGTRGAPSRSNKEFRKMNQKLILGHNHSATIFGPIWRVGTSTPKTQFYVTTPSTAWTNSHCAIFENGQRTLLNIIDNSWHG